MAEPSLVTVIATCFNHERYLVECLESIRAQSYPHLQLVIADDCSTDGSVALIRDWLRGTGTQAELVLHDENRGLLRTRNETIALARGTYVSSIATDDAWLPEKLATQVELLERLPSTVGLVYSDAYRMDDEGRPLPGMFIEQHRTFESPPEGDLYEVLLAGNFIPAMSTMVRRECFEAVGPYDEQLAYEDWDMWLRIARRYEFAYSPYASVRYRVHERSLTSTLDRRFWETDLRIQLKHLGHSAAWDAVLWRRIARLAYRLNHPETRTYARNALRTGGWRHSLVLNALVTAGIPYRRIEPVTGFLRRIGLPRAEP